MIKKVVNTTFFKYYNLACDSGVIRYTGILFMYGLEIVEGNVFYKKLLYIKRYLHCKAFVKVAFLTVLCNNSPGDIMYRRTYAKIDLNNIKNNVTKLVNNLNNYKYHFGVVKADSYGHDGNKVVKAIVDGGCNYLCVATLEEALFVRKEVKRIPILCLGPVDPSKLKVCIRNNITITVNTYDYINYMNAKNVKVHIKVNTGMNRLGINNYSEFMETYHYLEEIGSKIEGVYTHIYNDSSKKDTLNQVKKFQSIIKDVNVPIVHIGASGYALNYPKEDFINGIRFGIAMYGLIENNLDLQSTFSLYSNIIQINEVKSGDTVGYNGAYKPKETERIAVVPIGYADGIIRKNVGRYVYIKDNKYQIVGNICMDMLFVKVDESIEVGDKVAIIKDNEHINDIAKHLDTISYEVICSIGKRIPRIYK